MTREFFLGKLSIDKDLMRENWKVMICCVHGKNAIWNEDILVCEQVRM